MKYFFSARTAKVRTIVLLLKGLCRFLSLSLYLVWQCFLCLRYVSGLVRVSCTVFYLHRVVLCARAELSQGGVGTSTFFSGPSAKIGWMTTQIFFVCVFVRDVTLCFNPHCVNKGTQWITATYTHIPTYLSSILFWMDKFKRLTFPPLMSFPEWVSPFIHSSHPHKVQCIHIFFLSFFFS